MESEILDYVAMSLVIVLCFPIIILFTIFPFPGKNKVAARTCRMRRGEVRPAQPNGQEQMQWMEVELEDVVNGLVDSDVVYGRGFDSVECLLVL